MQLFCAVCGKETEEIIKGLCVRHFLEKYPVLSVPETVNIELEKTTGGLKYRGKWHFFSHEVIAEIILSHLKVKGMHSPELSVAFSGENEYIVEVNGTIDGIPVQEKRTVTVLFSHAQSDAEMKLNSNYHEAILQVRFREKSGRKGADALVSEVLSLLEKEKQKDSLSGISGMQRKHSGADFMVGSKKAAVKVARLLSARHNGSLTVSHKLIGRDKFGKEKKRFTYCVRV